MRQVIKCLIALWDSIDASSGKDQRERKTNYVDIGALCPGLGLIQGCTSCFLQKRCASSLLYERAGGTSKNRTFFANSIAKRDIKTANQPLKMPYLKSSRP